MPNKKITFLAIVIFIVVWMALELLFPRVSRAETGIEHGLRIVAGAVESAGSKPSASTDKTKGGTVGWFLSQKHADSSEEDCHIIVARNTIAGMNPEPKVGVQFAYGEPVEFYKETLGVKVARILDVIRAPEVAKDQLGMELYDVDALPREAYEKLVTTMEPIVQASVLNEDGGKYARPSKPLVAFVAPVNMEVPTLITDFWAGAGKNREIQFIGAPVQWTTGLADLLRYKAGDASPFGQAPGCASYGRKAFMKAAMHSVIASAEGIDEQVESNYLMDIEKLVQGQKMYLAIAREAGVDRELKHFGIEPIDAVSFRSAWESALKFNKQGFAGDHP